ncbi:PREDICTED: protocadherin-20 [Hipposideros armiger]|uniref:Protocadherin-20 n=1 Tax=Hipposideros armiger TaxID=186990 RepID=A0A8B7QG74_HIPAR|nr:PREDICTED: protocadherin-20 [Hipposideros armiger]
MRGRGNVRSSPALAVSWRPTTWHPRLDMGRLSRTRSTTSHRNLPHLFLFFLLVGPFNCLASYSRATELLYSLNEGLPAGVLIGSLAEDLRLMPRAAGRQDQPSQPPERTGAERSPPLSFSLASRGLSGQYVTLDNRSGELHTSAQEIDREALCLEGGGGAAWSGSISISSSPSSDSCLLLLDVLVLPQEYFRFVKVKIAIRDINDNAPQFPVSQISVWVPENAPVNTRLAIEHPAMDPDVGTNGVQTYRLLDYHRMFTLDVEENETGERTPYLIVMGLLDRETQDQYVSIIIAEDGGSPPLLGSATLTIGISDINDNCPLFTDSQINVTVYGNATVGTPIAAVQAVDRDLGTNAQITYSYSQKVPQASKDLFHLDETTGVIKLFSKIGGSVLQMHKLTILANGPGCIPAVITALVSIIKVVFRPPEIVPRYIANEIDGIVYLKELEPVNTPIAFFTIRDPEGKYKVNCYLDGEGPFRLSPYKPYNNEYLLETTKPMDYELQQFYEVTVVAWNSEGFHVKKIIKVQLLDDNDNAPIFLQPLIELTIEENNAPNAFLTKLYATDADSGERGQVSYFLGPDAPSYFSLDSATGILTVSTQLDREEKEKYRYTVRAVDSGKPPRQSVATVALTVLDKNDNSPRFINKDFSFFVPENFPGYGEIGVISVTDADAGRNGWVALSVVNQSDIFVIDTGKGMLRAKVSLDREQQSSYTLWVEAVDGGEPALSSTAKITILLLDINDNPPLVLFPQSNMSYLLVLPSTLPGSPVTEVYAVDKDTGMNAVIAYSIIGRRGPRPESFRIDPKTGNITLEEALLQTDYGLHRLLVKVSDHGYPEPLHSTVMVNLFVNDTVSNESYIESLLRKEPEINIEEKEPQISIEPTHRKVESGSCMPTLVALSVISLGSITLVTGMGIYICLRRGKKHHREDENLEVQIPLKGKIDLHMRERKPMDISNI